MSVPTCPFAVEQVSDAGLRELLSLTPIDEVPYDENSAEMQALDLAADSLRNVRKEALERVTLDSKAWRSPPPVLQLRLALTEH